MTWQQDNQQYWDEHNHEYPFHAQQTESITADYTSPEHLSTNRHGAFLRVPLGTEVLWGFSTEAHRDAFLQDFGGAVLPSDVAP